MANWKLSSEMGFEFEDFSLTDINEKVLPLAYKNMKKEEYAFYDIVLLNKDLVHPKTAECKFDEMGSITGNICIEVGCWGRQSGLLTTKADYWIISDGNITYIIETQRIRDCINENVNHIEYRKKERVSQGKGKYKEMDMYLIPKRYFEPYCCEIGNVNEMKYTCLL